MSYILDALRRSQAERERGQVPGLDAQPALSDPTPDAPPRLPLVWIALALTLVVVAGLAALLLRRDAPPAVVASAPVPVPAPVPLPAPVPAPAPVTSVQPRAAPATLPRVVSAPAVVVAAAPAPAAKPAPAPAVEALAPPVPLARLSAEQRRELPSLTVGGSVWSDNAASRFVILGGQVVHEGEALAPGLVLERIAPKSAVLRWRDMRIELAL